MTSLILSTATIYLLPLLLLLSIYLLVHGHDAPGGGFVGGLVAAAAFALYAIAHGADKARRRLRVNPIFLMAMGLLTALLSGCMALFEGKPFLTGMWRLLRVPAQWKIGSPQLFDAGVYFVVIGVTLTIIFSLAEE
jgi:multicomponent Na+:H+ antiporter subunit B